MSDYLEKERKIEGELIVILVLIVIFVAVLLAGIYVTSFS